MWADGACSRMNSMIRSQPSFTTSLSALLHLGGSRSLLPMRHNTPLSPLSAASGTRGARERAAHRSTHHSPLPAANGTSLLLCGSANFSCAPECPRPPIAFTPCSHCASDCPCAPIVYVYATWQNQALVPRPRQRALPRFSSTAWHSDSNDKSGICLTACTAPRSPPANITLKYAALQRVDDWRTQASDKF